MTHLSARSVSASEVLISKSFSFYVLDEKYDLNVAIAHVYFDSDCLSPYDATFKTEIHVWDWMLWFKRKKMCFRVVHTSTILLWTVPYHFVLVAPQYCVTNPQRKKKKQTKMCWKIHFSRSFSNMDATRSGWPQSHSGIERKKHFFFVHIINVIWTWYNRHTSATVECASCGQKFSVLTNKHKNHLIKQPNCESHNLYGAYTSFIFKIILDIRYICFVLSFGESIAFLPNSYALNFIYSSKIHPK